MLCVICFIWLAPTKHLYALYLAVYVRDMQVQVRPKLISLFDMCYGDGCSDCGFQIGRGDDNGFLLSWQQINEVVAVASALHGDLHENIFC